LKEYTGSKEERELATLLKYTRVTSQDKPSIITDYDVFRRVTAVYPKNVSRIYYRKTWIFSSNQMPPLLKPDAHSLILMMVLPAKRQTLGHRKWANPYLSPDRNRFSRIYLNLERSKN
jgi:hypothetical protein